ncbi:hypothetical protein [Streptomyces sp. NPDC006610]|uniref:hypothetical protein n=1 Tax=Streptomyces sp. NPDC006610 TaxID=3154584 RepID=UPI0033AE4AF5
MLIPRPRTRWVRVAVAGAAVLPAAAAAPAAHADGGGRGVGPNCSALTLFVKVCAGGGSTLGGSGGAQRSPGSRPPASSNWES